MRAHSEDRSAGDRQEDPRAGARRLAAALALAGTLAGAFACAPGGRAGPATAGGAERADTPPPASSPGSPGPGFRIRSDMDAPLNATGGWVDGLNEAVTVRADEPFRIRFEVESDGARRVGYRFRLQARRNGGEWEDLEARDFPYPDEIASPRASIVATEAYATGAQTTDVLDGSSLPFAGGSGVSLDSVTPAWWPGGSGHGEWEWPVVIRRWADGAVTNETGDVFEFRMTDAAGRPLRASPSARVTLRVPDRLLGGTFVETPGRIGPWQAGDGSLYFIMEPAETDNVLMVVRSRDGGDSWAEVDGARRPAADDLEGFGSDLHRGRIHMLHQTSDAVWYHAFGTADDPEHPEAWAVRDELVARPGEPPVQVATLVARPDGSLVAVYGDSSGLAYRIRSRDGGWQPQRRIDGGPGTTLSGPQAVLGAGGRVHLAYTAIRGDLGSVRARTIRPDGTLTPETRVADGIGSDEADYGSVAPLVFLPGEETTVILYRTADGYLHARRLRSDGSLSEPVRVTPQPVAQNAVDSDQVGADAVGHDGSVHVLFIDRETGDIHHVRGTPGGDWSAPRPVVQAIDGQWVRGTVVRAPGGQPVYGFVYDAGSDGGSGMNWYGEVVLEPR